MAPTDEAIRNGPYYERRNGPYANRKSLVEANIYVFIAA